VIWPLAGTLSEEASALHDWLYIEKPVSRAMADKVFLEALDVMRRRHRVIEKVKGKKAWRRGLRNVVAATKARAM
jgi:hypothetical protein